MNISTVASVQANGIYENANGVNLGGGKVGYWSFIYQMDDGTIIKANHKQQQPFAQGTQVQYTIKGTNEHGSWGSVGKVQNQGQTPPPQQAPPPGMQQQPAPAPQQSGPVVDPTRSSIEAQVALKEAVQAYHVIGAGSLEGTDPVDPITAIKGYADEFYSWLQTKRV